MQTQALDPPIFSRNMLSKTQNQFFIIIQNTSKIFMMLPPVAKTGEMTNHGGFGGRHGQNRRWKDKNNILGGKRLNFVFWRRLAHRAMSDTRRSASNLRSSSVRIFVCTGADFRPFKKDKKMRWLFGQWRDNRVLLPLFRHPPTALFQWKWWSIWSATVLSST